MTAVTLAAAPTLRNSIVDGTNKFIDMLLKVNGGKIGTALAVVGGLIILLCVVLLLSNKFWPSAPWNKMMQSPISITWAIIGLLLGVALVAPKTVIPFLATIIGVLAQAVIDFINFIFF